MKIKTKLLIALLILLLFPGTIIGISSFKNSKAQLEQMMLERTSQDVVLIDDYITETISGYFRLINSLTPTLERTFNKGDLSELYVDFQQVFNANNEVTAIYIATNNGDFYDYPNIHLPADYDPRKREWFIKAKKIYGKAVISNPYIDPATNQQIVTISKSLSNGKGVIGIDVSLDYLKRMILDIKIGENGYPIVLDENKNIVVHPAFESGQKPPNEFLAHIKTSTVPNEFSSKSTYFISLTNSFTGWTVVGTIDKSELTDKTLPILVNTGIYVMLFLVIGGFVAYFIIRIITIPTNLLIKGIAQVENGNLNVNVPITSNDEFGKLTKAFNKMTFSLQQTITKLKESQLAEIQSNKMAYHDELTGLPNRRNMTIKLTEAINRAVEHKTDFSVVFIDLDEFKEVNDQFGHEIGDRLLQEVAFVLKDCLFKFGVASRWAGDEFVLLIENVNNPMQLDELISKINRRICEISTINGYSINVSASIGVAKYPHNGIDVKTLLSNADQSMYAKKETKKTIS